MSSSVFRVFLQHFLRGSSLHVRIGLAQGQLLEYAQVVNAGRGGDHRVYLCAEGGDLFHGALRALLVIPEVRGAHRLFKLGQAGLQLREVKDTSAVR